MCNPDHDSHPDDHDHQPTARELVEFFNAFDGQIGVLPCAPPEA